MEGVKYNLKENVENYDNIDFDANLCDEEIQFLKENFNITDSVHNLSDIEYDELYEKLIDIEVNEVVEAAESERPVSVRGEIAAGIVTFMGNQFIEGGRRYPNK